MSALVVTILSCSLRGHSHSRHLAHEAARQMAARGDRVTLIDLRDLALPAFDDVSCFAHPAYPGLHRAIADADGVVIAAPVYNWGLGGAVRNVIELTGATSDTGLGTA